MEIGTMVKFLYVKNTRGYPLVGQITGIKENSIDVNAFGVDGPGTKKMIKNIPLGEVEVIEWTL